MKPGRVHLLFGALFCVYLVVGLRSVSDYGVSADDYAQRNIGRLNLERVTNGSQELQTFFDRYYGPAFETPLYAWSRFASRAFDMPETTARHTGTFLFFAASLVVFYLLLTEVLGHPRHGLVGVMLLVATPRFFAESFYNTKDLVFLASVILVLYAVQRRSLPLLIITTAFAIGVRPQGLLLLPCVSVALLVQRESRAPASTVMFVTASLAIFLLCSPVFWNNTLANLKGFWRASSNPIGVHTFYFGAFHVSPDLPWHYHFVWTAISSLLSVVVLSLFGIGVAIRSKERQPVLIVAAMIIAGTYAASVFLHPRSYDGWRHIYYVYPLLVMFAVYGLRWLIRPEVARIIQIVVVGVLCLEVSSAVRFTVANHPNEYVYFNPLVRNYPAAQRLFDFDYWGMSYKPLGDFLTQTALAPGTKIYFEEPTAYVDNELIPALTQRHVEITRTPEQADLYVSLQREVKTPPPAGFVKIFSVQVEGADLSAVYRRR